MLDMGGEWMTKDGLSLIEEGTKGFLTYRGQKKVSDYTRGQVELQSNNMYNKQNEHLDSEGEENTNQTQNESEEENGWYNHENWHKIFETDILGPRPYMQTKDENYDTQYSDGDMYDRTQSTRRQKRTHTLNDDIYDSMYEENTDTAKSQQYLGFPKDTDRKSLPDLIVFRAHQSRQDGMNTQLTLEPGDVLQVHAKGGKTGKRVTLKIADIDYGFESLVNRKTRPNPRPNARGVHRQPQNRRSNALYNAYITCEVV